MIGTLELLIETSGFYACVNAFYYAFSIWHAGLLRSETFDLKLLVKYELLLCGFRGFSHLFLGSVTDS